MMIARDYIEHLSVMKYQDHTNRFAIIIIIYHYFITHVLYLIFYRMFMISRRIFYISDEFLMNSFHEFLIFLIEYQNDTTDIYFIL